MSLPSHDSITVCCQIFNFLHGCYGPPCHFNSQSDKESPGELWVVVCLQALLVALSVTHAKLHCQLSLRQNARQGLCPSPS